MRTLLAQPRWNMQVLAAWRPSRVAVVPALLGVCALSGWGAFIGNTAMQRDLAEQVTSLQADRDGLVRRIRQLEQANGELLRDSEGKLAAIREELRQMSAARDAVKAQLAASQRELAASKKRLEQALRDRVNETGSIKAGGSTKKPTPKP